MTTDSLPADLPGKTGLAITGQGLARLLGSLIVILLTGCEQSVELGAGALAPLAPEQWELEAGTIAQGDFRIEPVAGYRITAKVLSKRRYRWDELAPLVPWDFALGWGAMSDEAWLAPTKVTQGDRFMFWHLYDSPLNIDLVNQSSANVHLIPANQQLLEQIESVPKGAVVTLEGQLVNVHFLDQRMIPSSLSRLDTGPGACEILLVKSLKIEHPRHDLIETAAAASTL
jgi:hypothetical protein